MHAELPEKCSKITFTTDSTFAKIVLVLKNHGIFSSCKY